MEWGYALLDCFFNSGPNNMNSFFFWSIAEDNWQKLDKINIDTFMI